MREPLAREVSRARVRQSPRARQGGAIGEPNALAVRSSNAALASSPPDVDADATELASASRAPPSTSTRTRARRRERTLDGAFGGTDWRAMTFVRRATYAAGAIALGWYGA